MMYVEETLRKALIGMKPPNPEWFDDTEYWSVNRHFIWSRKRIESSERAAGLVAELLSMKEGESVLDLACGFGRYTLALSKLGFSATGVDLNPDFTREARDRAAESELDARFLCMDMRDFIEPVSFDHVLLMYNSFGYFQDQSDDVKVLRNCLESLKPGGNLLIHTATRELMRAHSSSGHSRYWYEDDDGTLRLEESSVNDDWTWNTTRWILVGERERREFSYGMRIYSSKDLIRLLSASGFTNVTEFGGVDGRPYDSEKNHLVLLARKPELSMKPGNGFDFGVSGGRVGDD